MRDRVFAFHSSVNIEVSAIVAILQPPFGWLGATPLKRLVLQIASSICPDKQLQSALSELFRVRYWGRRVGLERPMASGGLCLLLIIGFLFEIKVATYLTVLQAMYKKTTLRYQSRLNVLGCFALLHAIRSGKSPKLSSLPRR
jgi:hypothetical protein